MKGLYKSTGYWQTQAAKEDWAALAEFAKKHGFEKEANNLVPNENWGWRRIDKRIGKLREILSEHSLSFTLPSAGG